MHAARVLPVVALVVSGACANATPSAESPGGSDAGQLVTQPVVPLECSPSERMPLEGRASPYDSTTARVNGQEMLICYGRPAVNDRVIFGGLVPLDQLWRTGANEPTVLHLPFTADIAGIRVQPGSYSLYTVPSENEWTLVINRSTSQWGHESAYTPEIEAQEVGRATIPTERLDQHVERFTIRSEPNGAGADILLEWERVRARIPVRALPGAS